MDLHSKMTMSITSTMTSPVTKTAKTSKWLRLHINTYTYFQKMSMFKCEMFTCINTFVLQNNKVTLLSNPI